MDDKILALLEEKQFSEIKKRFSQMHAADIAEQFDDMENRETAVRLFRLLGKEMAADVFAYMDPDSQELLISAMTDTELCRMVPICLRCGCRSCVPRKAVQAATAVRYNRTFR